jgi:hypothetical protein
MDEAKALEEIDAFLAELAANLTLSSRPPAPRGIYPKDQAASDERVRKMLPGVQAIAEEVEPGLGEEFRPSGRGFVWEWYGARDAAQRARGIIENRPRMAEILGPTGPSLRAKSFHPLVWEAAARLYDGSHRRNAVTTAWLVLEQNLTEHRTEEPPEAVALEQLAALSLLARWIDETEVEALAAPTPQRRGVVEP